MTRIENFRAEAASSVETEAYLEEAFAAGTAVETMFIPEEKVFLPWRPERRPGPRGQRAGFPPPPPPGFGGKGGRKGCTGNPTTSNLPSVWDTPMGMVGVPAARTLQP